MSDLAKHLGLTKGGIYHHFENKEEIMRSSLRATARWFEKHVFSIAYLPELSGPEKLEQLSNFIYKGFTNHTGGCFFANTIMETSHVEDTFLTEIKRFFSLWEEALIHIFKDNRNATNAKEIAQEIIADIEGSIILMTLHKNPKILRRALNRSQDKY
ncbi:MAG: TetR/AcrR family transcriptional regulator [Flavobacteriales bacterium]|nr:TetR/AcrR family transcriptional regulator [Flavobacteriales bacterium]